MQVSYKSSLTNGSQSLLNTLGLKLWDAVMLDPNLA